MRILLSHLFFSKSEIASCILLFLLLYCPSVFQELLLGMEAQTQLIPENLPVGLRFQPTDQELLTHYLMPKLLNQPIYGVHIMVLELSKYDPWDLLAQFKKKYGDDEVYFFCRCEYNKSSGNRKRTAGGGHWKCTGNPRPVKGGDSDDEIGTKRSLVFHNPDATQFIITEYAYTAQLSSHMEDFVLCKLKKKSGKCTKKIKKVGRDRKLEKRPNKKARKVEPPDGNAESTSTLNCGNQNLEEMTANSTFTQGEESNHSTSYFENQHLNKTTDEATNPEFTQNVCKRVDISSSCKDESTYSIAMQMTITLPCNNGNNIVSHDFRSLVPMKRTDISASYITPFDFDNQNQNNETDMSIPKNYWISLLDSIGDTTFQGQNGEKDMPALEDNQVSLMDSSDVGDNTSPKMNVQKWLEEFLEL